MKYLYTTIGLLCLVAIIVVYFQNTGVAINTTMTGFFFRSLHYTDGLMIPCLLLGFGSGMFLTLGIKGMMDGTFDSNDGFGNI